jgi:hypothetical protein
LAPVRATAAKVSVRAEGLAVAMRRAVVRDSQQRAGSWPAGRARMVSRRKAGRCGDESQIRAPQIMMSALPPTAAQKRTSSEVRVGPDLEIRRWAGLVRLERDQVTNFSLVDGCLGKMEVIRREA